MVVQNILGDKEVNLSHILLIDPINAGSVLLTTKLVYLKRENTEAILTVKITEWSKFIYFPGLSIEY